MAEVVDVLQWDDEVARLMRQADGFRDVTGGVGVEQAKAVGLCLPAADAGDVDTLFSLGNCYANDDGVAEDRTVTVEYNRRAADVRHAAALFSLGLSTTLLSVSPRTMRRRWCSTAARPMPGTHALCSIWALLPQGQRHR
jgi:hypothetical protein